MSNTTSNPSIIPNYVPPVSFADALAEVERDSQSAPSGLVLAPSSQGNTTQPVEQNVAPESVLTAGSLTVAAPALTAVEKLAEQQASAQEVIDIEATLRQARSEHAVNRLEHSVNTEQPMSFESILESPLVDEQGETEWESEGGARLDAIKEQGYPEIPCSRIWGIDYAALTMPEAIESIELLIRRRTPSYVVTANLNYAMLCEKNARLLEFTREAALVLCDGMPILWRSKLSSQKLPERVAGSDLIYTLTQRCAERGYSVYFYGAAEGVAQRTADRLKELYPRLRVAGVQSPPFHAASTTEIQASLAKIKHAKPDVLLVALGQPKGEYWIQDHLDELGVPVSIQLGASFDFVAGNAVRAPKLWQRVGAEWLYRMLRDPKRLAPRYFWNAVYLLQAVRRELIEQLS